ncbi:MAG: N-acetylmuramoyl-L-alanine amidase family protein [Bacillota bacterium]
MRGRRMVVWLALVVLSGGLLGLSWRFASGREAAEPVIDCPAVGAVLLDPGHGGIDGGANRDGMLEKEIVLDIALRTERYLKANRIPVLLTRREDVDLGGRYDGGRLRRDLNHRIRMANRCQASFVLSIHVNSAANLSERGMMLFYQPSPWGRDAAFLFDDILRRWPLHQRREPPHPRGDFAILRWSKAPAVLVELGFITHPEDRERLADPTYREQVAQALAAGCGAIWHQWVKQGSAR